MIFDSLEKGGKGTRRLRYALVASVLVHLLLLWPRASMMEVKDTPLALQATILDQEPAVAPAPTLLPSVPSPLKTPLPPVMPKHAVAPAPTFPAAPKQVEVLDPVSPRQETTVVKERQTPASLPVVVANAAPASAGLPPVESSARPVPATKAANARAVGAAGKAAVSDLSKDDLHRYRLALASQARRFKRYPAQARALGWTGTADIRVDVDRDGHARGAILARSSGHEALDRAALAMIDAGARRTRLPDNLRGRDFSVRLPVVFNLEDE
ncbi:MAG: energy transducer TonB [Sulfuritalea sp.]|nr:energy transducer TonB [Sulfuritalea sp.]